MYWVLAIISMVCLSGDCDNFVIWTLWEIFWFLVFMLSTYMVGKDESQNN